MPTRARNSAAALCTFLLLSAGCKNAASVSLLSADLLPGRTYAIQCIFRDSATASTHRELGMYKTFVVRLATAQPSTAASLVFDTIVGTDCAYSKYPRTLTPGWYHFAVVNAGKQRHEINVAMLKLGVTLKQVLDVAGKGGDIDSVIDESLGVLHAEAVHRRRRLWISTCSPVASTS